jgi:tetratricopeptide (TPR) repeat protein
LVLAALAAFSNSFSAGFALDNRTLLLDDARIQSATAENVSLILHHSYWWPHGESGLYRPLTTLSYLFNYAVLGNSNHPAGYHWINFFLHAANVLLVFALLLRLTSSLPTAFCIALLWGLHPALTESVTNMIGRADLLAGFGVLAGLLCYLRSKSAAWRIALAGATAIGVFSKESAVVLPGLLVLYEIVCGRNWRRMIYGCAATALPIAIMLWQRHAVLSAAMPAEFPFTDNPIAGAGFWIGRLTAIEILARYLWIALWPMRLSADYSYAQIPLARGSAEDWLCWIAIACAIALSVFLWRRNRLAFFFSGFAFLNLLPSSNLLFPIGAMMAERFLYLPLVGLIAAAVLVIQAAAARSPLPSPALAICVALIAALLGARTWIRNLDWADDMTMATAGVQTSPRTFKFHRLLAAKLIESHGSVDRAAAEADRAIEILAPLPDELDLPAPWTLASVCHRMKGDSLAGNDAKREYEQAAKLALRSIAINDASRAKYNREHGAQTPAPASQAEAYRALASAYLHLNRPADALQAANQARNIDPGNAGVYEQLADSYLRLDRGEDAAIALAQGLFATGSQNLRAVLMKLYQSGVDEQGCAIVPGPRGPALNPSCDIVHRDLCEAIARAGRSDLRGQISCPAK